MGAEVIGQTAVDRQTKRAKQETLTAAFDVIERLHADRKWFATATLEEVMVRAAEAFRDHGYYTKQTPKLWGKLIAEGELLADAFTPQSGVVANQTLPESEYLDLRDPALRAQFAHHFRYQIARLHEAAGSRNGRTQIASPFAVPLIRALAPFLDYCQQGWVRFSDDRDRIDALGRLGDAYTRLVGEALEQVKARQGVWLHGFRVGPPLADLILLALTATSIEDFVPGQHTIIFDNLTYFGQPFADDHLTVPASLRRASEQKARLDMEGWDFRPLGLSMPGGKAWPEMSDEERSAWRRA